MDLDTVIRARHPESELTQEAFDEMDEAAINLLRSLSTMANLQLIMGDRPSTKPHGRPETSEGERNYLQDLTARVDEVAKLGADFERLHKLMQYLLSPSDITKERNFSLAIGPYPLFTLPPGDPGELAIGRLTIWRRILKTLPGMPQYLDEYSRVSLEITAKSPGRGVFDEGPGNRVSSVIGAIFQEFRRLNCVKKTTHEIRLHVSDELYTACPGREHNLDMFISGCPGGNLIWQNAQCGDFPFDGTPLSELLQQNLFRPIGFQAYHDKTAARKFTSGTKAQVALGLSRCLMDFFDKGLELASHSWIADNVHFRETSTKAKEEKRRLLYVSLRPSLDQNAASDMAKMFNKGSPVVLSFAKLLLEVLYGEAVKIQVKSNENDNFSSWLELGKIVEDLRRDPDGGPLTSKYLEVVDNCLKLWATLSNGNDRTDPSSTIQFMRKAIYEKIVHKLELIAGSESTNRTSSDAMASHERRKRKTQDPMLNESPAKKPAAHLLRVPFVSSSSGLVNGQNSGVSPRDFVTATKIEDSEQATEDDDAGSHGRLSLYDEQGKTNEREQKAAEGHLKDLINCMGRYIKPRENGGQDVKKPIKVAIIDSGIDLDDSWISGRSTQIVATRNWTGGETDDCADTCGHGTHITRLISKIAPAAEIYIAKVSKRKKFDPEVAGQVAQVRTLAPGWRELTRYQLMKAIEWAVGVWKVDIISLSMAMDGEDPRIKKALDKVLSPPHDNPKKVVVMAAASNWGGNRRIAFPASCRGVICVHSTDGHGNPSNTNPTAQKGKDFAVLGMSIKSSVKNKDKERTNVYISGTSFATAIGVGIAANVLEIAKGDPTFWDEVKGRLCSSWGVSCVFKIMSEERAGYRNVMPWRLFDGRPEEDVYRDIKNALEPDV
ncbi:hypothetical protein Neosp_012241 [[Neocosmospora] mangrovei]